MARALFLIVIASGLAGCASNPSLPCPTLSDWVNAPQEEILSAAAAEFESRNYHAFRGNPDMVVATKHESTFWTTPAWVAGFVVLPAFIITWPVVSLFDQSLHKEFTMWWPARAFTWALSTDKDTTISLRAKPMERGGSWVTVEVMSPIREPQYHARQVIDALFKLEPSASSVVHPSGFRNSTAPTTDNTR